MGLYLKLDYVALIARGFIKRYSANVRTNNGICK